MPMLMGGDDRKKKIAMIIATKLNNKPEQGTEDVESSEGDEYTTAAEEVLGAIERKDPKELVVALKSFVNMCMDAYEESPHEEGGEESEEE